MAAFIRTYGWLLFFALALFFLWLRRRLRCQQAELRQKPSRWQEFVAETKRLNRDSPPSPKD